MADKIQTMIPRYGELNRIYRDYIVSRERRKFTSVLGLHSGSHAYSMGCYLYICTQGFLRLSTSSVASVVCASAFINRSIVLWSIVLFCR